MEKEMPGLPRQLLDNRQAITRLAASGEARELMTLLDRMGGVQQAARAAAGGDTGPLSVMVEQIMHSQAGADLARRIQEQAQREGLGDG